MKWMVWLFMSTVIGTGIVVSQRQNLTIGQTGSRRQSTTEKAASREERLIFASGVVEGARRKVPLRFEIEGRLDVKQVVEGEMVRKGQVLARLNDDLWIQKRNEAQAKLAQVQAQRQRLLNGASPETREVARAEVGVIEVRVNLTARQLKRAMNLAKQNAVAQALLDERRYNYDLALAELTRARARHAEVVAPARRDDLSIAEARIGLAESALRQANTMVQKTVLVAPGDGVILRVRGERGELTGPESPEPLFTMTSVGELRVRAYVEELDVVRVGVGQNAFVTADGSPGKRFTGTVISCAPSMAPKRMRSNMPGERIDIKVREVVIVLENANELVIGLPVDVFIDPKPPATPKPRSKELRQPESIDQSYPAQSGSET